MRTIIVTGHARSGTSLTASVLDALGVDMGSNSRKADHANEAGYFENTDFVEANQKLLEEGKRPALKKIVENNKSELWGAKDPRFLLTLDDWLPYLSDPHIIICMRNPVSVAQSICYRDNGIYSKKKDFLPTLREVTGYNAYIPRFMSVYNLPILFVRYEAYFDGQEQIKDIAEFIDVPYKPVKLADKKLKHF